MSESSIEPSTRGMNNSRKDYYQKHKERVREDYKKKKFKLLKDILNQYTEEEIMKRIEDIIKNPNNNDKTLKIIKILELPVTISIH